MRLRASQVAALLFVVFSLAACGKQNAGNAQPSERAQPSPSAVAETKPKDGVRRVTLAELQEALAKGEAIAVDVRGTVEYELGHIRDARSIPLGLIASRIKELPPDKLIVTYCD